MSNKPIKFIRSTDKMVLGENYFPDKYKYVVNDAYLDAKEKGTIKPNNHVENYEEKKEDKKSEEKKLEEKKLEEKKLEEKKKEEEKIKSFYGNDTNIKEKDGKQIIELSDDGFWIPGINMEKDKEYEFYNKEERKKEEEKLKSLNKNKSVSNNRVISRKNINNINNKNSSDSKKIIIDLTKDGERYYDKNGKEITKEEFEKIENSLDKENKKYDISNNKYKELRKLIYDQFKKSKSLQNNFHNNERFDEESFSDFIYSPVNEILEKYNDENGKLIDRKSLVGLIKLMRKEFNGKGKTEKDHYRKKADDIFNKTKISNDKFNLTDKQNKQISLLKTTIGMKDPISYLKDKGINIDNSKYNILINSIKSGDNLKIKNNLDYYLK